MKNRPRAYFSFLSLYQEFLPPSILRKGSVPAKEYTKLPVRDRGKLKLATLWFDEVILQLPSPDYDPSFILSVLKRGLGLTQDTLRDLERSWVPVHKYERNYKFLGDDPWNSKERQLVEVAETVSIEEAKKEYPQLDERHPQVMREAGWSAASLIDTVNLWFRLMDKTPCCFIPNSHEQQVLEGLFIASTEHEMFEIFSEVLQCRLPDLSAISWDRIVQLRHSDFMDQFRQKMYELYMRVAGGDKCGVKELVDEMLQSDMRALAKAFRPSPAMTLVKGIVSNIPLPMPINPISVILAAEEVHKEYEILKKYGWLYFLLEVEESQG